MWKEGIVCRADALLGFRELVDSLGGDPDVLVREAGINPKDLKGKGKYICFLAFQRLLVNTARHCERSDFGLIWAENHTLAANNFGPIAVLLFISKDVRSFIESWVDYSHVHSTGTFTRLVEGNKVREGYARIVMQHSPAAPDTRQLNEAIISVFHKLFQDYSGVENPVSYVGFPHKSMSPQNVYDRHFKCPVEFNANGAYLEFKSAILDKKVGPTFNPGKRMFKTHIEKKIKKLPTGQTSFSAHIGLMLPHILGVSTSDAAHMAETLGMSQRKMQRLLKDEGTSYSFILDEVRQAMACRYLQNSEVSVARIAEMLDYTSPVAFTNAFKRWTNESPRDYRNSFYVAEAVE